MNKIDLVIVFLLLLTSSLAFFVSDSLVNSLLDVVMLLVLFLPPLIVRKTFVPWIVGFAVYVLAGLILSLSRYNSFYDSVIIFKPYYYVILGMISLGRPLIAEDRLFSFFKFYLVMLGLKYLFDVFYLGMARPKFLVENNFELVPLFVLYQLFSQRIHKGSGSFWYPVILLGIIYLSGSRSGFFVLVFVLVSDFLSLKMKISYKLSTFPAAVIVTSGIILLLSPVVDLSSFEFIDRVRFLNVFKQELANFSLDEILFGRDFITPLSVDGAAKLRSYESLFSSVDKLIAYSVVLHLGLLRLLFDHGLIFGVLLVPYIWSKMLGYRKLDSRIIFNINFIFILNSLSVSGYYSTIGIFSLILILNTRWNVLA